MGAHPIRVVTLADRTVTNTVRMRQSHSLVASGTFRVALPRHLIVFCVYPCRRCGTTVMASNPTVEVLKWTELAPGWVLGAPMVGTTASGVQYVVVVADTGVPMAYRTADGKPAWNNPPNLGSPIRYSFVVWSCVGCHLVSVRGSSLCVRGWQVFSDCGSCRL